MFNEYQLKTFFYYYLFYILNIFVNPNTSWPFLKYFSLKLSFISIDWIMNIFI